MTAQVRMTRDRLQNIIASLRVLERDRVMVGIPDENADRLPVEEADAMRTQPKIAEALKSAKATGDVDEINNAAIGYINEFGSPKQNIPARPFLVPGVESALPGIIATAKKGAQAVLKGNEGTGERTLGRIGTLAQSAVRRYITTANFEPLSERTIAARKARGRKGIMRPLIDTGQLRNSITYVIRRR